jgi:stalled ribosome rescue protein Dom34
MRGFREAAHQRMLPDGLPTRAGIHSEEGSMNHVAIWIDHSEARIYALGREGSNEWTLRPHDVPAHLHHKAGLGDSGKAPPDKHYFHSVAEAVKDAAEILIVGPGSARTELLHHLKTHDPEIARKVVGTEPLDHPSDGQIVAYARRYFRAADQLR